VARGRMLSKSWSTSEKRARLHDLAGRLAEFCQGLFPLMVVHADDFGRHAGDPFTVKLAIDPISQRTVDEFAKALQLLHEVGLIIWYRHDGRQFYQIADFDKHQVGLHRRTRSEIPEVPGSSGNFREIPSERNGTEQKRTEETRVPDQRALRRPADLWEAITDRLELSEHNRVHWFEPCGVHRITETLIEIEASATRALWLSEQFAQRINTECADLLAGRKLMFVVNPRRPRDEGRVKTPAAGATAHV
jgi:hypothetical protein